MSTVASRSKRRIPQPTRARGAQRKRPQTPPPHPPPAAGAAGGTLSVGTDARSQLSRRERQIVGLLIGGRSVKESAAVLGLSPRTVEGYLERLKQRFRVPRLLALVVHLVKQGLVE